MEVGVIGMKSRADERTAKFYQEIYDEEGGVVEIHEKYPADKGHQRVK